MRKLHFFALLALIAVLVGCDHTTKHMAQSNLRDQPDVELVSGVLDLTYTENTDVGFSLLRAVPVEIRRPLLIALGVLMVPLLALMWFYRRRDATRAEHVAYALFLAGALGNVGDRIMRGYVIDFIHLHHWPIFNVADICLTVGAILLLFSTAFLIRPKPRESCT